MSLLEVPVPVLHPAQGATAWAFFLIGIACALLMSAAWLAHIWRGERSRGGSVIGNRPRRATTSVGATSIRADASLTRSSGPGSRPSTH